MINKKEILQNAKKHLAKTLVNVEKSKGETQKSLNKSKDAFKNVSSSDRVIEERLIAYFQKRLGELKHLEKSPYFSRCDVIWDGAQEIQSLYFSKFALSDEKIYSWTSKASSIRFEDIGKVTYERPDGEIQKANLIRKDNYMISDGEIKFLSTESVGNARELVYQEHFSNRKTGFVLPEIVSEMEKSQDRVIRANHRGPFLISGPAGSGKTTLALHRVAYLATVPDLAKFFKPEEMIVFVQDEGTKKYFSHLLPELGINNVEITTFSSWAKNILNLKESYISRFGKTFEEKDIYEFRKIKALKNYKKGKFSGNRFSFLEQVYGEFLGGGCIEMFAKQKKQKILDRIDLTLLLMKNIDEKGKIGTQKYVWHELKTGKFKKKKEFVPFEYALAVVDEFQNYLPEQLNIIKSCINKRNDSIVYVGDMRQQIRFGTLSSWDQIDENLQKDRQVVMQKVYRNTKNILKYISSIVYKVTIPKEIPEGKKVLEIVMKDKEEEISYISSFIENNPFRSLGVISKNLDYLDEFKKKFGNNERINLMSIEQSQGVEFEKVFLVGVSKDIFKPDYLLEVLDQEFVEEKVKINKDLLYIALTRAISELFVLGRVELSKVSRDFF